MKKKYQKINKPGNWRWERHKEDNLTTNEKLVESGPYRERRQTKTLSH